MALTEKMYFTPIILGPRKKPKRRHDLELGNRAKARSGDAQHAQGLLAWLKTLPLSTRMQVLADKNPWLSAVLRQMFVRKVKEGDGLFSFAQEQIRPFESTALDDYFKFQRLTSDSGFTLGFSPASQAERLLEQQLRLCDSQEYLDTVTVAPELAADLDKFLRTMAEVSRGQAFTWPCRVAWDNNSKVWLWETPGWNSGINEPLVVWAACCLERSVWMKYWEALHLDPRVPSESQAFAWESTSTEGYLANRTAMIEHWKDLGAAQRCSLLTSLDDLTALFQTEKQTWLKDTPSQYSYPQPSFSTLTNSNLYGSFTCSLMGFFGGPAGTYYSACRARMQCFQNSKSMEYVLKAAEERFSDFVDFLFLSPLERAGSIMDSVTRVLAGRLNTSYQQRLVDDLISTESTVPTKPKPRKQKRAKRRESDVSTVETTRGQSAEEGEDLQEFVKGLVLALVEGLQLPARVEVEEMEGFQVVSGRKKTKKTEVGKVEGKKKGKKKGKKRKAAVTSPPAQDSPNPIAGKAVFWAENALSFALPTPSTEQFPPLAQKPDPAPLSSLHFEIKAFEQEMHSVAASKLPLRQSLLEKVREIVSLHFPGAEVLLFGSHATGLALPSSDMDVVILYSRLRSREDVRVAVLTLAALLMPCPWTVAAQAIDTASVPLIKLQVDSYLLGDSETGLLKVDISFDGFRGNSAIPHIGLASAAYVNDILRADSRLRSLVLAFKHLLVLNDLNCAYTGGLSSYAVVLWTAAYAASDPSEDLGLVLKGLFRFYGLEFDPRTTTIDLSQSGL